MVKIMIDEKEYNISLPFDVFTDVPDILLMLEHAFTFPNDIVKEL